MTISAAHVAIFVTLFLAYNGFLIFVIKYLLDKYFSSFEGKIDLLARENKELKEKLAEILAAFPIQYVRADHCKNCRDEWIRIVNLMDSKLTMFSNRVFEKFDEFRKEMYDRDRRSSTSAD